MVKLPQVAAVVRARSAAGLSPLAFELETLGLVIAVTYGFLMGLPFSAFGETVVSGRCRRGLADGSRSSGERRTPLCWVVGPQFGDVALASPSSLQPHEQALLVQNNILLLLIYHYQRRRLGRTLLLVAVLAAAGWVALSGQLSAKHISALYDCNNAILILSRWGWVGQEAETVCPSSTVLLCLLLLVAARQGGPVDELLACSPGLPPACYLLLLQGASDLGQPAGARHGPAQPDHVCAQHGGRSRPHLHLHPGEGGPCHAAGSCHQ